MKKSTFQIGGLLLLVIGSCSFLWQDWVLFKDKTNSFTISFPRMPTESSQQIDSEIGQLDLNIAMYEVSKDKDDNFVYGAMFTDYPDSLINSDFDAEFVENFFTGAINGAVTNVNGELLKSDTCSYKHFPGRVIQIDYGNGQAIIEMKILLMKNRSYILQVISPFENPNNPSSKRFFDSFSLMDN